MPILLKTQVDLTAKTPVTARRARVGGLCGFRGTAERVPAESRKTGRCANVWERCESGKCRRRSSAGGFRRGRSRKRRSRRKGLALFCASPSTSARSAGSFGG